MSSEDVASDLRERVKAERIRRNWSIREAAGASGQIITNQTWGRYEEDGPLTLKVRRAVAAAFEWPDDWPTNPPEVMRPAKAEPDTPAEMLLIVRQLGVVATRLEDQVARQERLIASQERLIEALEHQAGGGGKSAPRGPVSKSRGAK